MESMWYITHRYMARCCKSHPWVFSTSLITACWSASTPCYKHITQVQTVTLQSAHQHYTTCRSCMHLPNNHVHVSIQWNPNIISEAMSHKTVPFKYHIIQSIWCTYILKKWYLKSAYVLQSANKAAEGFPHKLLFKKFWSNYTSVPSYNLENMVYTVLRNVKDIFSRKFISIIF